jgi:M6 family metalloprotease-like protein
MARFTHRVLMVVVFIALVLQPVMVFATESSRTGIFVWRHGDDQQGQPVDRYFLQQGSEEQPVMISEELLDQAGGAHALDGRLVNIEFAPVTVRTAQVWRAVAITPLGRAVRPRAVSGAQPWLTIMCKFNDVATEPRNYTYFANMYGSTFPGLNHYWREVSLNNINIDGSGTAGSGWYTLPQKRAYYVDANEDGNLSMEFSRAANDCTAAANADVDFSSYVGINLMFNSDLDGYAWGGGMWMTLDGVTKFWNMTWEPPWGYAHITVMSHEMGHGFGLPHSSGKYGQTYDNAWDVMSDAWYNCTYHATYGCLGQHTISYHKNQLGWIHSDDKVQVSGARLMRIDQLAMANPDYYHMAIIPIADTSEYYTVEVRQRTGYDIKLPAKAVIIHHVNPSRQNKAQVIDSDLDGDTSDDGAQWLVGEQFVAGSIKVDVVDEHTNGFKVLIRTVNQPVIWGNAGVAGATISYTGGSTTADAYGDYAFAVTAGWSGSIAVSKTGNTFTPSSRTVSSVTSDQGNMDFSLSTPVANPEISGNVGVAGATITYTGGSTTSDSTGDYTFTVATGWTGNITPSLTGYAFTPSSISLSNVTTHQPNQDFVADANITISGNAGIAGATISYTGGLTTADSSGNYSFVVASGWSGSITPSKSSYRFVPTSIRLDSATTPYSGINFTAALNRQTATFTSNGSLDGTIQETRRLTGVGDSSSSVGQITIGDTHMRQQLRGLLSFDTSSLPDTVTLTKVTLRLSYAGVSGRNPFNTHGRMLIDVRSGWFGSSKELQAADFSVAATQLGIGQLRRETATRYSATWTSGMTTRVNKRGLTQLRLYFSKKHDNDWIIDTINFYDGSATTARRPTLIVEYVAP